MVLSTLHTNSAVAAVSRLYDLDVDPGIISTSLSMVVAQRLVRRICEDCREEYEPDIQVLARVGLGPDHEPVFRGAGCASCGNTGFAGRVGIYEIFRPTTSMRKLINDKASEAELRVAARQTGMALLREDALAKITAGLTSPDEVLRVVQRGRNRGAVPELRRHHRGGFRHVPVLHAQPQDDVRRVRAVAEARLEGVPLLQFECARPDAGRGPGRGRLQAGPDAGEPPVAAERLPESERDESWPWTRTIEMVIPSRLRQRHPRLRRHRRPKSPCRPHRRLRRDRARRRLHLRQHR